MRLLRRLFRLPRLLHTASFRLVALYVGLFLASSAVLGIAVFLTVSNALDRQTTARIETETTFLRDEFRAGGIDRLLTLVRSRGRGASAGTVLVHANTERSVSKAGDVFLDGVELAAHALSVAESLEVNMSSFTLTLLFWMATDKHPPSDAKMRRAIAAARKTCFA